MQTTITINPRRPRNKTATAIATTALQLLQNRNFSITPLTPNVLKGYATALTQPYNVLHRFIAHNPNAKVMGVMQGYTVLLVGWVNGVSYHAIRIYGSGNTSRHILTAATIPALKAVIATNMAINANMRSCNLAVWQYGAKYGGYPTIITTPAAELPQCLAAVAADAVNLTTTAAEVTAVKIGGYYNPTAAEVAATNLATPASAVNSAVIPVVAADLISTSYHLTPKGWGYV